MRAFISTHSQVPESAGADLTQSPFQRMVVLLNAQIGIQPARDIFPMDLIENVVVIC